MDYSSVNTIWVLLGAALVFFMQAGFAMVETGFTRAKNAGNIIMKNLMDFCIGTPTFWIVGCCTEYSLEDQKCPERNTVRKHCRTIISFCGNTAS